MGGVRACQADVLLDRRPRDPDAEFHEFTTDSLHAPEAILPGHLLDQGDRFRCDPWAVVAENPIRT